MRIRIALLTAAIAALAPGLAGAGSEAPPEGAPVAERAEHEIPLGARAGAIFERQRTGVDASADAHGLTPPAERRARKRYLQSFEHPIPDRFEGKDMERQ